MYQYVMSKNIVNGDARPKKPHFFDRPSNHFHGHTIYADYHFPTYFGPTVLWASTASMTFLRDSFYETPPSVLLPCVVLAKPR